MQSGNRKTIPKKRATAPPPSSLPSPRAAPLPLQPENLAFARKLRAAMHDKRMSASDLARAIWGTSPDPRGYQVAKNRDRIGTYLAGTGFPSKETMPKLAAALGLSINELPVPRRSLAPREFRGTADITFSVRCQIIPASVRCGSRNCCRSTSG